MIYNDSDKKTTVYIVCPRISDPFYIVFILQYKMGHYFWDTQYVYACIHSFKIRWWLIMHYSMKESAILLQKFDRPERRVMKR